MKKEDKQHIKIVNLWASRIMEYIENDKRDNDMMTRQLKRNDTQTQIHQAQLADGLKDHNIWLKEKGKKPIKAFKYLK